MTISKTIRAELLKLNRTLALRLAVITPLALVVLQIIAAQQRQGYYVQQDLTDGWWEFVQSTTMLWSLLMLPLFVTLETALLSGLEHGNRQLKHLFTLPVPRGAIYAAKQFSGMLLIGLSMLALALFLALGGLVLRLLTPGLGFEAPIPWLMIFQRCGLIYLGGWLIIAIHTWISLRWPSFVVASAAGITLTVAGMIVAQSEWGSFYPWALPGLLVNQLGKGEAYTAELLFGSLGGVIAALIGGWDVTRREVVE
jgi:hypothetical protein